MQFEYVKDLEYVKSLLDANDESLADLLQVSRMTLNRWRKGISEPSSANLKNFYNSIYKKGIRLNRLKEKLYQSDKKESHVILFHGAKEELIGEPSISFSGEKKDFGPGFYMGESLFQSESFVGAYPNPSIYIGDFSQEGVKIKHFSVSEEWMLLVAYFRGKLEEYKKTPLLQRLLTGVKELDVIIAPIADNTMYSILNEFIDGTITDLQCLMALDANRLGKQYVFLNDNVLKQKLKIKERLYFCEEEKEDIKKRKLEESEIGKNKVKLAKRKYAAKGKYIEELFYERP